MYKRSTGLGDVRKYYQTTPSIKILQKNPTEMQALLIWVSVHLLGMEFVDLVRGVKLVRVKLGEEGMLLAICMDINI